MTPDPIEGEPPRQAPMPTVVVICGPPCSGKTGIARRLRQEPEFASFVYLEMDELRLSLWPSSHTPEDRAKAYARMHDLASEALRTGAPGAILVATYQPSRQRRAVRTMADGLPARIVVFECAVSPDKAVESFHARSEAHAATDLYAERVWDLAHDFRYFKHATRLDTSSKDHITPISTAVRRVRSGYGTAHLDTWIDHGNPDRAPAEVREAPTSKSPLKLTARSRKRASWLWALRKIVFLISAAAVVAAGAVLAKDIVQVFVPTLAPFGLPGKPAAWIQIWAVVAALASGLLVLHEHLFDKPEAKTLKAVKEAEQIPRLALREGSPSNAELYRRYCRRIKPDEYRLPIEGVPLWFVVLPRATGFEVHTNKTNLVPLDSELLQQRAASIGLDWSSYLKWREKEKMDQYFGRYREVGVRAHDISVANDSVKLTVCMGSFVSHICTELSANLYVEGRFGFELRQVFEGPPWSQSDPQNRLDRLDLGNLPEASKTYEMLVGVQVALTTADDYLLLQRRSDLVQSATGGVASSGAGSAQWKDLAGKTGSLTKTALREIGEEIGWAPHSKDDLSAPFLGAAFNLLRGRDLNFYCHFHTHWTLQEINAGLGRWQRIAGRLKRRPVPVGVTRAPDAWEVAHIIPVPITALLSDGTLRQPFSSILGDARHVRGLLYCLAKSDKYRALQNK